MTVVMCKLPKKLAAKLDRAAKTERRSKQALVREAIEQRLKTKRHSAGTPGYEFIKHLIGTLEGPSDLGTNPAHMKGFGK
jgi:metal-responsive CopG/Arc/MetJ family transcriptional regulator